MDKMGRICNKCGNSKNKNGECEECLAREEVAATATASFKDTISFPKRAREGKISKTEARILNNILFALTILCTITVFFYLCTYKYKENAVNKLVKVSPQNQTSDYVL